MQLVKVKEYLKKKKDDFYIVLILLACVITYRYQPTHLELVPLAIFILFITLITFAIGFLVLQAKVKKQLNLIVNNKKNVLRTAAKDALTKGLKTSNDQNRLSYYELTSFEKEFEAILKKEINTKEYDFMGQYMFYAFVFGIVLFSSMLVLFFSNKEYLSFFSSLIQSLCS
ncbi:hypothetical protein BegalDRAFT_3148 [Beggiatoa alba B18LD]|uniref:Uncharacterized protein n=1 Tax=Beggiatoa alba B18LD TaxID=395493 RepID=I3CK30_9GAMM|nr:hypothetical protein [Beggiatoa alba]EIJ43973.1 hypothetical protein BegalDRAFT_3148 [Beggiatoa alba B18LD]